MEKFEKLLQREHYDVCEFAYQALQVCDYIDAMMSSELWNDLPESMIESLKSCRLAVHELTYVMNEKGYY